MTSSHTETLNVLWRFLTKGAGYHLRNVDEFVQIDTGLNAETVEHVHDVFGGDVAGGALGVGTPAETRHRGVDHGDTHLQKVEAGTVLHILQRAIVWWHKRRAAKREDKSTFAILLAN